MCEQMNTLQRRISSLERRVVLLAMCCGGLTTYLLLFAARGVAKAAAQLEMLTVKRLAVVDEKGTERVVMPVLEILQNKKVIYKRSPNAPNLQYFSGQGNNNSCFGRDGRSVTTFAKKLKPIPSGWVGKEWALLQSSLTAVVQRLNGITRFHAIQFPAPLAAVWSNSKASRFPPG